MKHPKQAHSLRVDVCPHGFPVIALLDGAGRAFGEAHIDLDKVEWLISKIRDAAADAEAAKRPRA